MDSWCSIPGRGSNFSLCHHIYISSEAHPGSYSMVTGGFLSRHKAGKKLKKYHPFFVTADYWTFV
jgi:hypothetical protein